MKKLILFLALLFCFSLASAQIKSDKNLQRRAYTASQVDALVGARIATTDSTRIAYLAKPQTFTRPQVVDTLLTTDVLLIRNGLRLALRTVAIGDSVFGKTILRDTDTVLVMWNGTAWITIADLAP